MKDFKISKFSKVLTAALIISISLTACGNKTDYKKQGIDALNNGDYEKAESYFDKALSEAKFRVSDNEVDISYYKACAEYLSGDSAKAEKTFTNLIDFDEKNPDSYYLRGLLYLTENKPKKAKKDFDQAIKLKPDDFKRYLGIYEAMEGVSLQDDGREYLEKAIAIKGKTATDYMNRGRIYVILGQEDVAEQAYKKAIDKGNNDAYLFLALLYDSQGKNDDAEENLNKFIKHGKETAETDSEVSAFYIKRGDYDHAIKYIEKGMKLKDTTSEQPLKKNYIILLEHEGEFDRAYEEAAKYVAAYPFDNVMKREYTFLSSRVSTNAGISDSGAVDGTSSGAGQ